MGKGVCLLGFANTKIHAPWDRPNTEFWPINELWGWLEATVKPERAKANLPPPQWHAWFEMHGRDIIGATKPETNDIRPGAVTDKDKHLAWLRTQEPGKPIYMLQAWPDIPAAVAYPLEELTRRFEARAPGSFKKYFTSSIGYMLALAITQGRDEQFKPIGDSHFEWIGLYGIDLAGDSEYGYQRPNAEWFAGFASGLGVDVYCHPDSAMFKGECLYGYELPPEEIGPLTTKYFIEHMKVIDKELAAHNEKQAQETAIINTLNGAKQETANNMKLLQLKKRGIGVSNLVQVAQVQAQANT